MKSLKLVPFLSIAGLFAMSACLQAANSTAPKQLRAQTAGPLSVADSKNESLAKSCDSSEGKAALSEIGEGADALFQILVTDIGDLRTIHDRAETLSGLEARFSAAFPGACKTYGITAENTSARMEKLENLAKETDADVIRALAKEIWDLFNPNLEVHGDVGASSGNPFAPTREK